MKKSILLMSALFFCGMTALAQEPLYKMKLTLQDGSKLAALTDEIDSMQLTTVKTAEVHVTERYKTSSSIGINIEAEASVTRVQAAIVAGSEKDPNINYTEYVQKHSVCDAKGSYTLAFDFLKPESIYTIYVLAYDENGLPTGLKSLTCSTGAVADDPFTVTTTHVGTTTLKYNVTAKDASVKYCTFATGYDYYQRWQLEEGTNGDVIKHFVSMWSTFASWYGENWQTMMKYDRREGTYEGDGYHLMWDARQVVITFGMDDDGNLVTPIQVDSIHTNAPTPVDMDIPVTVLSNEWGDQQIKAAPTTNTPYFITMQPAAYVDLYKTDAALLRALCYEADNINPTDLARTRDEDLRDGLWEFRVRKDVDTDYYIIAVGLDEGAPATRAFKTKITVPGGSF